jgi:hypothetical protein
MLQHATARHAYRHVRRFACPAIFHHSIRTYLYAVAIARQGGHFTDAEALFVSCMFHDAGTGPGDGQERFEIESADAAAGFVTREGWQESRVASVWQAIAFHTSPGIAERLDGVTRFVRLGVRADFGDGDLVDPQVIAEVEHLWPRLDVERTLVRAIVAAALVRPAKAPPGSWPGALVAAHLANPDSQDLNIAF